MKTKEWAKRERQRLDRERWQRRDEQRRAESAKTIEQLHRAARSTR